MVVVVGAGVEANDRHTVLCLVRIALPVVEVGGEAMNDARNDHCVVRIVSVVVVVVAAATVVDLETVVMIDTNTVPCWVDIALGGTVAVATVVEAETGVIETAATNDTHTVHCSVHTALALVRADTHPYKRSHVADGFGARSLLEVHRQV